MLRRSTGLSRIQIPLALPFPFRLFHGMHFPQTSFRKGMESVLNLPSFSMTLARPPDKYNRVKVKEWIKKRIDVAALNAMPRCFCDCVLAKAVFHDARHRHRGTSTSRQFPSIVDVYCLPLLRSCISCQETGNTNAKCML